MKFFITIITILLFVNVPSAHAQQFFNTLPDVPMMQGLVEIEDEAFSFDKPEGRILSAAAYVDKRIDDSALLTYYQQSLPQFGWQMIDRNTYMRGQERLEISINEHQPKDRFGTIIEITITP